MKVINQYYYPNPAHNSEHEATHTFDIHNIEVFKEYVKSNKYLLLCEEADVPPHDVNMPIIAHVEDTNGGNILTKFKVGCSILYKHLKSGRIINVCILKNI